VRVIPKAAFCHDLSQITFAVGVPLHSVNSSVFNTRAWLESGALTASYTRRENL
jgi:hypothetical protein